MAVNRRRTVASIGRMAPVGVVSTALLLALGGCGGGSSAPRATPTAPPVASPTPSPLVTSSIIFGSTLTGSGVTNMSKVFNSPKTIAWVAHLAPAAHAGKVTVSITRTAGVGPHPQLLWQYTRDVAAGTVRMDRIFTKAELVRHGVKPGTFLLAITQTGHTLASGSFKLESGTGGGGTSY